jgi:DNA-binding protein H-NS
MAKVDFRGLDVSELMDARNELDRLLGEKVADERRQLQARLDALAAFQPEARNGSVKRGRGRKPGTGNGARKAHPLKGRKAPIKYRGPGGETWSGRGLAPRWLAALEQKGKKRESFLVAKN